jgi:two-component system nitrate/nitrite response regulator NarL
MPVPMPCVSIVIADRHPVVLWGLKNILGDENGFIVVATCCDGAKSMQAIRDLSPDIALLDMSMSDSIRLEILAAVTSERLCTRVVFLAAAVGDRELVTAAAWGAYGVVTKEATPEMLVDFLRQVASGELLPLSLLHAEHRRDARIMLTERECQIMELVSEGLSNKEIGRRLNLAEGTIKIHLHHIYRKLAVKNRTALAVSTGFRHAKIEA